MAKLLRTPRIKDPQEHFALAFYSNGGRLHLRFKENGFIVKTKATFVPYLGVDDAKTNPELAAVLSKYQHEFNEAVCNFARTGVRPYQAMFSDYNDRDEIIPPIEFFRSQGCNAFCEFIDKHTNWVDITDKLIEDFKEDLETEDYADNTIRAYGSKLKCALDKAITHGGKFPAKRYAKILSHEAGTTTSVYLSLADIKALENVSYPDDKLKEAVRVCFLKSVYSGCRHSDLNKLRLSSVLEDEYAISGGKSVKVRSIRYISQKTDIKTTVPLKPELERLIKLDVELPTVGQMNRLLPLICREAGITSKASVQKCGKDFEGEKWEFVRSHTGRKTFATNLYLLGCSVRTIANYLGHKNEATTIKNYIWCGEVYNENVLSGYFK